jgi:hypothetical protein
MELVVVFLGDTVFVVIEPGEKTATKDVRCRTEAARKVKGHLARAWDVWFVNHCVRISLTK